MNQGGKVPLASHSLRSCGWRGCSLYSLWLNPGRVARLGGLETKRVTVREVTKRVRMPHVTISRTRQASSPGFRGPGRRLLKIALSGGLGLWLGSAVIAQEGIRPGAVWPDDRGQHIQAHGGGILKLGDAYYWFGEERGQGLDREKRYVSCYSSTDLAHWTFRNQVVKL